MFGYFCIGFINFMFAGRSLLGRTSLFSSYDFQKNDDTILSYFKWMPKIKREFMCYFFK